MFHRILPLLIAAGAAALPAQQAQPLPAPVASAAQRITPGSLRATLSHLANDKMRGRDTGSPELREAARTMAERCRKAGLQPLFGDQYLAGEAGGDGTKIKGAWVRQGKEIRPVAAADFITGGALKIEDDCAVLFYKGSWSRNNEERAALVRGKAVVIPAEEVRGRGPGAAQAAARRRQILGEEGAVLVAVAGLRSEARLPAAGGAPLIHFPAALSNLLPGETGIIPGLSIELEIPPGEEPSSFNAGAWLPGSDPDRQNEIIAFTAHLDHIGVATEGAGADKIYNGADDNASGSTAILAIAEAFASLERRPARPVLFLWFYGEERGFLGSRYYVANPARPLSHHRAVFNIEMVGRPDDIQKNEAWITGWNVSDFGALLAETSPLSGIRFYEHPQRSRMLFGASDNIVFATEGIPAHSISAGSLHKDYHQPSDETGKIHFDNMAAVTRGIFIAGYLMADGGRLPSFAPGTRYAESAARLLESGR